MRRTTFARTREEKIRHPFGGIGFAGPVMPSAVVDMAKRSGFLAAVVPPKKLAGYRFAGLGAAPAVTGASAGASAGATIGSIVPGIGNVIGAVVGAVVGAIGGALMGSVRPESQIWDAYKKSAGSARGIEYNDQFRNEAFVGLFRLGHNTFPPRAKGGYGPNDDARFLDDMAKQIGAAVQAGKLGGGDDAGSIFSKIVGPWMAQWGTEGNADWRRWENAIVTDQIDAYLFDKPIVATSYTTSRWAAPRLSAVVAAMPQIGPAPVPSTGSAPVAPQPPPTVSAPSPAPVPQPYKPPAPPASSGPFTVQPASPPPPATVTQTPAGPQVDVNALVSNLMQQGASNQQAFLQAMQSLQAQGVPATPAVQQAVAAQVSTAATQAGASVPDWLKPVGIVAAVVMLGFALARPAKRH